MAVVTGTFPTRPFTLYLEVNLAPDGQSVQNNQSQVNWALYITKDTNIAPTSGYTSYWSVDIDTWHGEGQFVYGNSLANLPIGTPYVLAQGSRVLNHNPDGTRQFNFFAGAVIDELGAAGTSTGTFFLPTIPRASKATVSPSPVDAGQPVTITTNRAVSSFTHTLEYKIGTASGTIATGVGASTSWTPPLALLSQIPSSMSGIVTITTKTYSGATLSGTTTTPLMIRVPATVLPDFTSITHAEAVPLVAAQVGGYVKGMSKLALGITGEEGAYGATITGFKLEVAGQTINAKTGTTPATINVAGATVPIVGTITDSRGQTRSKQITVPVLDWQAPVIDPALFLLRRSDAAGTLDEDGTTIRVDLAGSVSSLMVGGVQKNVLTGRVYTRERGTAPWTLAATRTPGTVTINGPILVSTYAIETSWEVRLEVVDLFATAAAVGSVATAAVAMEIGEGGVGFGKFWQEGEIDALGEIFHKDGVLVGDKVHTHVGAEVAAATETARGTAERATQAEVNTGTDTTRYASPSGIRNASYRAYADAAGVAVDSSNIAVNAGINITVTFPIGRFTVPPIVRFTTASARMNTAVTSRTTTGATLRIENYSPAVGQAGEIGWTAKQMTATSASG